MDDKDQDGLSDRDEVIYYTDIEHPDTDRDGYLDGMEVIHGYSPLQGGGVKLSQSDMDGDTLNDALERQFATDMGQTDTDEDGYNDFDEIMHGYDPMQASRDARLERKIVVDRTSQRLSLFVKAIEVFSAPVSTGAWGKQTPEGVFAIQKKIPVKRYTGPTYDYPNTKWNLQFKPQYYMHTAYWHNDFGKRTKSSGCVNMREGDAAFLYRYMDVGVPVEVIGKTPRQGYVGT